MALKKFKKILVALDGSKNSLRALTKAIMLAKLTAARNGIDLEGEILYDDNVRRAISKFAQFKRCNLIIMGFRGIDSPKEKFLGSKSHGVNNISKLPVLIVK